MSGSSDAVATRSGVFLASRMLGSLGFLVAAIVLARALDVVGRGAIAFISVSALTAAALVRLGVGDATVVLARVPSRRGVLCANLLLWTLASSIAAAVIVAAALANAGDRRPAGIDGPEIAVAALGVICGSFIEAGYALLLVSARVREQAAITAIAPVFYALSLTILTVTVGLDTSRAAAVWLVSQFAWAAAIVGAAVRAVPPTRLDRTLLIETLRFGLQAWIGNIAHYLNARIDQLLLGVLDSTRSLGLYATAVSAAEVVFYVPIAVAQALMSTVAGEESDVRVAHVVRAFRGTTLVTAILVAAGLLTGPYLLPRVFGQPYVNSTTMFWILLFASFGFAAMTVLSTGLLLSSMPRSASVGPLAALVSGIALDLVLIPAMGGIGAALAATIALVIGGATSGIVFCARLRIAISTLRPQVADVRLLAAPISKLLARTPGGQARRDAGERGRGP